MKAEGFSCELVQEFAKEIVYADNEKLRNDQLIVIGEQYRRTFVLDGKGHSIKNLTTSAVEDHGFYSTAMFTSTRKATTIKNLVTLFLPVNKHKHR